MKNKKIKIPAGLSRDVGVMIEGFNNTLELVAEQTSQIPKIKEDIVEIKEDVGVLRVDVGVLKTDMRNVKEDIDVIKTDIEIIKHDLKNKIDRNEFALLERRVALLESRR